MHLHRTDPADLVGLLSLDDADHLLTSTAIRTPSVRLAKDGAVLPESAYTRSATLAGKPLTGLVDARKALALFDDGATVVFQGLQRYWPPLTRLVAELELELGHPCQANAYLTPPGSQGFACTPTPTTCSSSRPPARKLWEVHGEDGPEDVLLEPGPLDVPAHRHPARRPRPGDRLAARHPRHQPAHLARPASSGPSQPVLAEVPDDHLPAGYLDDPARARRRRWPTGSSSSPTTYDGWTPTAAVETEIRRFLTSRPPRLSGGLHDVLGYAEHRPTPPGCAGGPATRACCSTAATRSRCCSATGR